MDYCIHLATLIGIYLILAQGLNICFGLGGLFNFGHIAVYSIGAYTTALMATELGANFHACLFASACMSSVLALTLGWISIKLRHDYFAIGTLAFSSVVNAILINWKSLTRGVLGIPGIPRPEIFGIDFNNNTNFFILVTISAVLSLIFCWVLFRSSYARDLRAQGEDPFAALALGKDIRSIRRMSFIISSMWAGIAGCLFAYYLNYIDPSSFSLNEMIFILSITIVGKPGSFWGVTAATVFLVLLPEPLRFLELPAGILGPMRQLLYSAILFLVVFWRRKVLFPRPRTV